MISKLEEQQERLAEQARNERERYTRAAKAQIRKELAQVNPKEGAALRDEKPPLDLIERTFVEGVARAMLSGAKKYGKMNYRTIPIYASTYTAAALRHAFALASGEDIDPDSGLSHWDMLGANVCVIKGAMDAGTYVDDRGPQPRTAEQELRSSTSNRSHSSVPVTPEEEQEWRARGLVA